MNRLLTFLLLSPICVATLHAQGSIPPPTNVTARAYSGNHPRVELSWQAAPGTWYCNLYRSINDTMHFARIAQVMGRTFEDHGVIGGRTYYYFLRAVAWADSLAMESPRSAIVVAVLSPSSGVTGTIRGIVVDDSTGAPVRGVRIRFFRVGSMWTSHYDVTDSLGGYEAVVDTGRYLIKAEPPCEPNGVPQYRAEWFENASEPSAATPVMVRSGMISTANFGLQRVTIIRYASISGAVRNEQGQPIPNATVAVMRSIQEMNRLAATTGTIPGLGPEARQLPGIGYTRGVIWSGVSDMQGRFRAIVPQNGSYIVAAGKSGYLLQYFNQTLDPTQATLVSASTDTSGVHFILRSVPAYPGSIDGAIRDSLGQPVPSRVILFPRPPHGQPPTQVVHSGADGEYTFNNLASGTYTVLAVPFSNYASAFYKEGQYGIAQWQLADSVLVGTGGTQASIGVLPIQSNGLTTVSGVALTSTGEPLVGGRILVRNASGAVVGSAVTTTSGSYSVEALPFGDVTLVVDREPFNPQFVPLTIPPNTYSLTNITFVLTRSNVTGLAESDGAPTVFALEQNSPNPFSATGGSAFGGTPSTTIRYGIQVPGFTSLKVYDVLGREVATLVNEVKQPGSYEVMWDATGFASGLYLYRLTAGSFVQTKKLVLLR